MQNINGYIFLIIFFILEGLFPIFSYFAQKTLPTFWLVALATGVSFLFGCIVFFKKNFIPNIKRRGY